MNNTIVHDWVLNLDKTEYSQYFDLFSEEKVIAIAHKLLTDTSLIWSKRGQIVSTQNGTCHFTIGKRIDRKSGKAFRYLLLWHEGAFAVFDTRSPHVGQVLSLELRNLYRHAVKSSEVALDQVPLANAIDAWLA